MQAQEYLWALGFIEERGVLLFVVFLPVVVCFLWCISFQMNEYFMFLYEKKKKKISLFMYFFFKTLFIYIKLSACYPIKCKLGGKKEMAGY